MFCNRGIYHQGWTAVTRHSTPWVVSGEMPAFDDDVWELYDTNTDWTQAHDLAAEMPEKLRELQRLWLIEAVKYDVLPLDDRRVERFDSEIAGRPELVKGNSQMLFGGMGRLSENSVINLKNKSHAVTAEIVVPDGGANGVIIAQGGEFAGWCRLPPRGQAGVLPQPARRDALQGLRRRAGAGRHASGAHGVRLRRRRPRQGRRRHPLRRRRARAARGASNATVPLIYSADETCDLGSDTGTPVSDDYTSEGSTFTGTINWVQLDAGDDDQDHLISPGGTPPRSRWPGSRRATASARSPSTRTGNCRRLVVLQDASRWGRPAPDRPRA